MTTEAKITFEDVFNIGILKPGHIYKILTKLEFDAGNIDKKYYYFIFNDSLKHSVSSLRISNEKYVCCGQILQPCFSNKDYSICFDIVEFLRKANVPHLKKNFIYNGFESIEYIYLQMFTDFPIDDEMLKSKLHIYERKDRRSVLLKLGEGTFT